MAFCLQRELRRPGRAAMAQNSPGPELRVINGPAFVSRRNKRGGWRLELRLQNRFCSCSESIVGGVISRFCTYPRSSRLSRYIFGRTARFARERPQTKKNLSAWCKNRGFNRGSRATRGGALTPRPPTCVTNRRAQPHAARRNSRRRRRAGPQKYGLGL